MSAYYGRRPKRLSLHLHGCFWTTIQHIFADPRGFNIYEDYLESLPWYRQTRISGCLSSETHQQMMVGDSRVSMEYSESMSTRIALVRFEAATGQSISVSGEHSYGPTPVTFPFQQFRHTLRSDLSTSAGLNGTAHYSSPGCLCERQLISPFASEGAPCRHSA